MSAKCINVNVNVNCDNMTTAKSDCDPPNLNLQKCKFESAKVQI